MLHHFWALPAFLRLALASQHVFSVQDDLLAYPQYEVIFSDTYISESEAQNKLSRPDPSSHILHHQDLNTGSDISPHIRPPPHDAQDTPGATEEAVSETYELMRFADSDRRYLCSIPIVPTSAPTHTARSTSSASEETELMRASDRGWELLKGLEGSCLFYLSGYWSYSFCYDSGVKQFHQLPPSKGFPTFPPVEDPNVESFMLGRLDMRKDGAAAVGRTGKIDGKNEGEVAMVQTAGETRFLVQKMGGGTVCDLTGKERRIDVQFHCHPHGPDRIGLIKETSTCSYLMVIHTPRLCNDVAFLPPQQDQPNPITCRRVLSESEIPDWEDSKRSEAELLLQPPLSEDAEQEENQPLPIVGGIPVGAKKDVGTPGKIIEPGFVVGGGKETYIGTLASSDGKMMGEKELKKLNIADLREVEVLMERLRDMAGIKGWKLEVVDTPRGRQLRAVVEPEEEGDGEDGGGGKRREGDEHGGGEERYKHGD